MKTTDTMLYHFVRSIAERWQSIPANRYGQLGNREELAVFLVESLCATLSRIEAQENQERRRENTDDPAKKADQ